MLVIRTDSNPEIGSGHVMRCLAIACEACKLGHSVVFAVSDKQSAGLVEAHGFQAYVLGGSFKSFAVHDGAQLAQLAEDLAASAILVDSYAVSSAFFEGLDALCPVAYIDDLYTFADGFLNKPYGWPVDQVVNYSFAAYEDDYCGVYDNSTNLCLGPIYAPVRDEFLGHDYRASEQVSRVLVTSGGTNPNQALEKMTQACLDALPDVQIDVVVGRMASFGADGFYSDRVHIHEDVQDMATLMQNANLAISAAGSTLYELCCVGVPTIALPIVENQMVNVAGFESLQLGAVCNTLKWQINDVSLLVEQLASHSALRMAVSENARNAVDGLGAQRIAHELLSSKRKNYYIR